MSVVGQITERDQTAKILNQGFKPFISRENEYEDNYRFLLQHTKEAVVVYEVTNSGLDFIFVDINPAAEIIDNIKRSEVIGKSVTSLFPSVRQFGLLEVFKRVWQTGIPESFPRKYYNDCRTSGWRENYVYKLPSGKIVSVYNNFKTRSQAERELTLIYNAVHQTNEGIAVFDPHGHFIFTNYSFANMHGYGSNELLSRHYSIIYPDQKDYLDVPFLKKLYHAGFNRLEMTHTLSDETEFTTLTNFTIIKDNELNTIGMVAVVTDVTEQKLIQNELTFERNKLSAILSSMRCSVSIRGLDFKVLYQNSESIIAVGNILGKKCYKAHGHSSVCPDCPARKSFHDGMCRYTIRRVVDQYGKVKYLEHLTNPIRDINGKITSCLKMTTDITKRQKTESMLIDNQHRLRDLVSQLAVTEEQQRRQISENLHDHICQWLALSILKLDFLRENASASLYSQVDDIADSIHKSIAAVRNLIFELSTPTLYNFGLEAAVSEYISEYFRNGSNIKCGFISDKQDVDLSQDVAIVLFRAIRELLTNIIKHAQANNVLVELKRKKNHYIVKVRDDGIGFHISKLKTLSRDGGFGIFNIIERLDYAGGTLNISTKPGKGSTFTMQIPLDN